MVREPPYDRTTTERTKRSKPIECIGCHITDNRKHMVRIQGIGYMHQTCFDIALEKLRESFKATAL